MVDLDVYIERIREACFLSPDCTPYSVYSAWRDRIERILADFSDVKDAYWSEMIDGE